MNHIDDLLDELRKNSALIVHFSHHAKMRENLEFPTDLLNAVKFSKVWSLSCCLVWPTHSMTLPGSVGIVLRPKTLDSIIRISNSDMGSLSFESGEEGGFGEPLSVKSFARSFQVNPNCYNEWRVRKTCAVAIYAEQPLLIKKRQELVCEGKAFGSEIGVQSTSVEEIGIAFPNFPIIIRKDNAFSDARSGKPIRFPY